LKRYNSHDKTDAKPQQNMGLAPIYPRDVNFFSTYDVSAVGDPASAGGLD